jgi:hypothetical protein
MRNSPFFFGGEFDIDTLCNHLGINVLLVDECMPAEEWRWQPRMHPTSGTRYEMTGILRLSLCDTGEGHYDVYKHSDRLLHSTAELPQVVKILHCIA